MATHQWPKAKKRKPKRIEFGVFRIKTRDISSGAAAEWTWRWRPLSVGNGRLLFLHSTPRTRFCWWRAFFGSSSFFILRQHNGLDLASLAFTEFLLIFLFFFCKSKTESALLTRSYAIESDLKKNWHPQRFHQVLEGLRQPFFKVLLGFTGFYQVLLGFIRFHWVLPNNTGSYWVLLGFTEFYQNLLGLTAFPWVFTGFDWVWLGFT